MSDIENSEFVSALGELEMSWIASYVELSDGWRITCREAWQDEFHEERENRECEADAGAYVDELRKQ